jgi:F-type H+-transporting ATPase subunit delta
MREETIARRYASALFAEAQRSGTLDPTANSLATVARTIAGNAQLKTILNQPVLTSDRKKEALNLVFGKVVAAPIPSFLNLLIDKRRINVLPEIQTEFARLVREHQNVALATATTALPLTTGESDALRRSLEARTGKKIELETAVDPAVLGGVFVRIGDTVLDGTVRGSLERLREQLLTRR